MRQYATPLSVKLYVQALKGTYIYNQHNAQYVKECLDNLRNKKIYIR